MEKEITIPSVLSSLNLIEVFLDQLFDEFSLNRDNFFPVLLTINESVQNSIIHGNESNNRKMVYIKASVLDNKLKITVQDEGHGFNMESVPDPTLPENIHNERGRGLFLIHKLADEVNLFDKGRVIEINFKIQREYKFF